MSFHIHRFQPFLGPTKSPLQFSLAETFAENSLLPIGSFIITEVLVENISIIYHHVNMVVGNYFL